MLPCTVHDHDECQCSGGELPERHAECADCGLEACLDDCCPVVRRGVQDPEDDDGVVHVVCLRKRDSEKTPVAQ